MSEIKDGGPAFPVPEPGLECGMTQRDYFAAKAMAAFMVGVESFDEATLAAAAYRMADAMLRARGQS